MATSPHLARTTPRLAAIGLVGALVVGSIGWFGVQAMGHDDAAGGACKPETLRLAVAPAMADVVDEAAAALASTTPCIALDVSIVTVADIAAAQDEADDNSSDEDVLPQLWIPDSPAWQSVALRTERTGRVLVPALASTAVAFGSGRAGPAATSWLAALTSPQLRLVDPNASGAAAMALLAPYADSDPAQVQTDTVAVAQDFGSRVLAGRVGEITIDSIDAGSPRLLPVTEQDYLFARRGNPNLTWRAPTTGVPLLTYPLIQITDTYDLSIGTGTVDVAVRAGEAIARWFDTDEAKAAIANELLRGPDGAPLADGQSVSTEKQLPAVAQTQADAVMKAWNYLVVPSSVLALIEASDSMDLPFGSTTRIGLTTEVAKVSLDAFPDGARLGSWAFSTNRGPHGQDWEEMLPLRRIDAPLGDGRTHRDAVLDSTSASPKTYGGAGLYDSILAAYKEATRQYNPAYFNAVVIYTDGPNDDPDSISLDELLSEIKRLYDPARQVQIVPIGLTDGADMATLGKIAKATDALAYAVLQASDIYTVLSGALLARE